MTIPDTPDVLEAAKPWMQQCGRCDADLSMDCTHPEGDPRSLIAAMAQEIQNLRAAAATVNALVAAAEPAVGVGCLARDWSVPCPGNCGGHRTTGWTLDPAVVRDALDGSPVLAAEIEALRAKIERVESLLCDPYQNPPANGQLLIVGTRGGHQDLPYREKVYQRSDRSEEEKPHEFGDWYSIEEDGKDYPLTYGELNWLDDPACDRGSVTLDGPYVHAEDIAKALAGDQP